MLGLVQDEPAEEDRVEQVEGMTFLMDAKLASGLERYFPIRVDYDERYWAPIRVSTSRASACC